MTAEYDPAVLRTKPYRHQAEDTAALLKNRTYALFHEMGSGKSKIVVDAAGFLHAAGEIDAVVVVVPAGGRGVWHDPETGEIRKHSWVPAEVFEYHARPRIVWADAPEGGRAPLVWIVTNYEYLRATKKDKSRQLGLYHLLRSFRRYWLVLDESSAVKAARSKQHKALKFIREDAVRCTLLNGTPVPQNPLDLWGQMEILNHQILGRRYRHFMDFRARHCQFGGWQNKQIVGWYGLETVQRLIAPYCVRRLKKDCLDLPKKIGGLGEPGQAPLVKEVPLREATWRLYRTLRREAILALPDREAVLETNAAVRIMRLSQLTSGHVSLPGAPPVNADQQELFVEPETRDVSDEKLRWTLTYLTEWTSAPASIVWCRWRRERERLVELLDRAGVATFQIYGGQNRLERAEAERAFHPSARGGGYRVLVAQPHAGGKALDLTAATEALYQSQDPSLEYRLQSEDRIHRATTVVPVTYFEVLATGPDGQKTIDHTRLKALRAGQELATWTCAAWRRALVAEEAEG